MSKIDINSFVKKNICNNEYKELNWSGSFQDYIDLLNANPLISRNAFQRIYDMIVEAGTNNYTDFKKQVTHYNFFDDRSNDGQDAIFGLDVQLMKLVNTFKSAALGYGPEKRVILLHGPVGSAKSTIARLLKKGLEKYSKTKNGCMYTFSWINNTGEAIPAFEHLKKLDISEMPDPMNDDPIKLLPTEIRDSLFKQISKNHNLKYPLKVNGSLNPASRYMYQELMKFYDGDWNKVIQHIKVKRLILSEEDRIGIGTFQPKDEKNQDSTELTGDINYRKIAMLGSDSDPRAFNFDGEFNIANRGMLEFVEVLKLDVAFLYDLLGASQEHTIKSKKFAQTSIDEVILAHTNEPEFKKLQNNEFMEALRDRTIKIDIPYITKLNEEVKIYEKIFSRERVKNLHIAPHTLKMAAMWAVLTRLEKPKKISINSLQKLKLYNGANLSGFTEESVKELRKESIREGLDGISSRYIQDKISNAIVKYATDGKCLSPFMVLKELDSGLKNHSLIANEELKKHYRELIDLVRQEYETIVKKEVQKAISADDSAIAELFSNYVDNLKIYLQKSTAESKLHNEQLMRDIELKAEISEMIKDSFRQEIFHYISSLNKEGKKFDYRDNERLKTALELKVFDDQKDIIKLSTNINSSSDQRSIDKIKNIKARLINNFGYDDVSAENVLQFVSSIFAKGSISSEKKIPA